MKLNNIYKLRKIAGICKYSNKLLTEYNHSVRVLAAMSGGVDSSVSAALLAKEGFEVIGAMMRFWPDNKCESTFETCCSPDAAFEARRVAEHLGIPFYLLDYRDEFEENIIKPFIDEYQSGNTPNPCVFCNNKVKFDLLVKKARMLGCDFVATGHYVRRIDSTEIEFHRGTDPQKDQTYFLWGTPKQSLDKILFPVGHLHKTEVRKLAKDFGLITAEKPESQNICFVPTSVREFLSERLQTKPGEIIDLDGNIVGEHEGVQFYTIGQKKGIKLFKTHQEMFVIKLDVDKNQLIVGPREFCQWPGLKARQANYLVSPEKWPKQISVQVRYRQNAAKAQIISLDANSFSLEFNEPQFAVSPGQSVVAYDGQLLLGGGFIAAPTLGGLNG